MSLSIELLSEDSDRDLERRVTAFLTDRSIPAFRRLYVQSRRGVVTLRGHVHTFYEKQLSGHVAGRVAGVVRIVDDVQVAEKLSSPRPSPAEKSTSGGFRRQERAGVPGGLDLDPVLSQLKEGQ
jgi:hypothetical protein